VDVDGKAEIVVVIGIGRRRAQGGYLRVRVQVQWGLERRAIKGLSEHRLKESGFLKSLSLAITQQSPSPGSSEPLGPKVLASRRLASHGKKATRGWGCGGGENLYERNRRLTVPPRLN